MAVLSPRHMGEFFERSTSAGLQLFHADSSDIIWRMRDSDGDGYVQEIELGDGLWLVIVDHEFKRNLPLNSQIYCTSLEFEFNLTGMDAGSNCIKLHLGNSGTNRVEAGPRCCLVEVFITPPRLDRYFQCFLGQMPPPLQQLSQRFFEQIYLYTFGHVPPTPQLAISEVLSHTTMPSMLPAAYKARTQVLSPEALHELGQVLVSLTTPAMQRVLGQILECSYQGTLRQIYLEGKALELVALRLEQVALVSQLSARVNVLRSPEIEKICEAKDILLRRLDRPPSLIELAHQVGMNDCTLKRGFRQVFGMTAMSCLHHYRMELAQQLLTIGEMNVNQVAKAIGYASRSSFYTAFRKQFGVSPHQYLTQNRKSSV
ncbi:AraC family transcriptional regulator [Microcoleus sp. B3-D7]|uniref:AraC family transcriptional regulator n=2 Tax=Microcoleus TaxID=44471 RepID=UPI002FCF0943